MRQNVIALRSLYMASKLRENQYVFFLLPTLIIFAVFMFWPLMYSIYLSFFNWNMIRPTKEFVGFSNYMALFSNPQSLRVMGNTFIYIGILLALNFVMPFVLAFVLNVVINRFKGLYRSTFFIPSIISLVVGSMIYTWILNPITGPAANIMSRLGLDMPVWSRTQGMVIVVISIITTWKVFGYNFIVLLGGISGVPDDVIESAKLDKIPLYKIFLNIVVPMNSAVGIYVLVMTIVQGMQFVFIPINILTQGGPNWHSSNLIYQAYHEAFVVFDTGRGAAFSVLTLLLFAFLLWLEFRFVEKGTYYEN
jgi:sn-glycerol 3-phosphate transport system permease protein